MSVINYLAEKNDFILIVEMSFECLPNHCAPIDDAPDFPGCWPRDWI